MRLLIPNLTLSPVNGAEAMLWLACRTSVKDLATDVKYFSHISILGRRSVATAPMEISQEDTKQILVEFENLRSALKMQ